MKITKILLIALVFMLSAAPIVMKNMHFTQDVVTTTTTTAGCSGGSDGQIGYITDSEQGGSGTEAEILYFPFTPDEDGDVTYIHAKVRYVDSGYYINAGIFESDGTKLEDSTQVEGDGSNPQEIHFELDDAVCLASGTTYLLGVTSNEDGWGVRNSGYSSGNDIMGITVVWGGDTIPSFTAGDASADALNRIQTISANAHATDWDTTD